MRLAEREQKHELQERDEGPVATHSAAAKPHQFNTSGDLPAVGGEFATPGPSASDRAYDGLPRELVEKVAGADEASLVQMLAAYPLLRSPILSAIGNVHGQPTAQAIAKSSPQPTNAEKAKAKESKKKLPAGYDDGPIQVDSDNTTDMQKVAGFNQIALSHVKEAHAPSHVRLPASVLEKLEDMSAEGQEKDQEQGGNLVRTYGGKWELRQTHDDDNDNSTYNVDTSNVGRWSTHVGIVHTHPIDVESPYPVSFSSPDLVGLLDEDQPLNIVKSGNQIYMISRTREFDALLPKDNDPDKINELTFKMQDTWKAAYKAERENGGGHASAVEKGVIAVCRTFHLIYYWGQGQDLHRVR
jgi:hypothetical protein